MAHFRYEKSPIFIGSKKSVKGGRRGGTDTVATLIYEICYLLALLLQSEY